MSISGGADSDADSDEEHGLNGKSSRKVSPLTLQEDGNPSFENYGNWTLKQRKSLIREYMLHCYSECSFDMFPPSSS